MREDDGGEAEASGKSSINILEHLKILNGMCTIKQKEIN